MVSAWIGIVSARWRVAVVILAVHESPGRMSSGGVVERNNYFEILGFLARVVLCEAATPVERRSALSPISVTCP